MLSFYINSLLFQQVEKNLLADFSQVSCNNPVIILRLSSKIPEVCLYGAGCCRRHTGTHIIRIFQSEIYNFTSSDAGYPGTAFSGSQNTGATSCYCPGG